CVYNDPAVAVAILRTRFAKVAYVDLDVHHGDGVQAIFADDPAVLTVSIHESPQTLWPRTGRMNERGENVANIPIVAGSTGDVWLNTFRQTALPALARFSPNALVIQLGTDTHVLDPLAHLRSNAADWLAAVVELQSLDLPTVVTGGGGYALSCVPRMWSGAVLTLLGIEYDDALPPDLAEEWGTPTFSDPEPAATGGNVAEGEEVVREFTQSVLPRIHG
ncbi:MAG: acetoin utilization protein AcuC, partial [Armatimonadota bacterium]